ncbi:MAG: TIGR02453 family protein [Ruegeria sp.]
MPDPFHQLIADAQTFLADLAANNSRDWFNTHKSRYETELKRPAILLLEQFAHSIGDGTGIKLFRPQRDVRFSNDKTPYNTHLHLLWTLPENGGLPVGFFFGVSPSYVSVGGGVMGFDQSGLTAWRDAVDSEVGDRLIDLLADYETQGFRIAQPELKRVPSPFDKAHPNGDLLRRKSITVWRDLPEASHSEPLGALGDTYKALDPFMALLSNDI